MNFKAERHHSSMFDVERSMFDVQFLLILSGHPVHHGIYIHSGADRSEYHDIAAV